MREILDAPSKTGSPPSHSFVVLSSIAVLLFSFSFFFPSTESQRFLLVLEKSWTAVIGFPPLTSATASGTSWALSSGRRTVGVLFCLFPRLFRLPPDRPQHWPISRREGTADGVITCSDNGFFHRNLIFERKKRDLS